MIAAWAKENGIRGYENYDPQYRNERRTKSSQRKKFNKSVNFRKNSR